MPTITENQLLLLKPQQSSWAGGRAGMVTKAVLQGARMAATRPTTGFQVTFFKTVSEEKSGHQTDLGKFKAS